jgi:hypothetical protein
MIALRLTLLVPPVLSNTEKLASDCNAHVDASLRLKSRNVRQYRRPLSGAILA